MIDDPRKVIAELRRAAEIARWFVAQETDSEIQERYREIYDQHLRAAEAYGSLADLIEATQGLQLLLADTLSDARN